VHKKAYFLKKGVKSPKQIPALLLSPTDMDLPGADSSEVILLLREMNRRNKQQMICFCLFHTFAPVFHFKLCSFCWWGRKNIFLPRVTGYPRYAAERRTALTAQPSQLCVDSSISAYKNVNLVATAIRVILINIFASF